MKAEYVALIRSTTPKMTQADVPREGSMDTPFFSQVRNENKPGFVHTDTGIVFGSRTALKKAIRIAWNLPNTLRRKNEDRFAGAVRRIAQLNDVSVPKMVQSAIERRIAAIPLEDIIRAEVQKVLNAEKRRSGITLEGLIIKIATDEAKRIVLENLTLDLSVSGHAHTLGNRSRALRLED